MTTAIGRESTPRSAGNGAPADPGGQLQQAATGLMDQAARTADAQASTRMTMAGDTLEGIARAIDDAADGLREQQPELANLTSTAADRLQSAATYLRDHSASEALDGVQQYARRQPALVVGGGLLAGLVLGRFLRTGASVAQSQGGQRKLGSGGRYGHASAGTSYDYTSGAGGAEESSYASTYGTDTSSELLATDAAATGGSLAMESDLPIDTASVDDLGGTSDDTTTGEGR